MPIPSRSSLVLALSGVLLISTFTATVASGAQPKDPAGIGADFKGPLGLQLYSLRGSFAAKGVPATLDLVKDMGIKNVELAGTYNLSPERFNELLKERGLTAVSGHFGFDQFRDNPEEVAKQAKALGLQYAGCAWISHEGEFDEADAREAARVFNRAGRVLADAGIQFMYHCHGYEFRPHGDGTLMDLIIEETDPATVEFQMDVFWVVLPDHDPAKLLRKHPNRWRLMHLKDMRKGAETGILTGRADVKNDVALGTGQMNWPEILKAAEDVGVKWYFIEDESPTVEEQIPQSLKFLESVEF